MPRKGPVGRALDASLRARALHPEDAAIVALAKTYARMIDASDGNLNTHGRGFRETLIELGMTPKTRAAITKGAADGASGASKLDELRARRERRA